MNADYVDLLKENMILLGSNNKNIIYLNHESEYVALKKVSYIRGRRKM